MKENDYVTYDVAELLNYKGFNIITEKAFLNQNYINHLKGELVNSQHFFSLLCPIENMFFAPTLYKAQQWLINKYKIAVISEPFSGEWNYIIYDLTKLDKEDDTHKILSSDEGFNTYTESLNSGIKNSLNFI